MTCRAILRQVPYPISTLTNGCGHHFIFDSRCVSTSSRRNNYTTLTIPTPLQPALLFAYPILHILPLNPSSRLPNRTTKPPPKTHTNFPQPNPPISTLHHPLSIHPVIPAHAVPSQSPPFPSSGREHVRYLHTPRVAGRRSLAPQPHFAPPPSPAQPAARRSRPKAGTLNVKHDATHSIHAPCILCFPWAAQLSVRTC